MDHIYRIDDIYRMEHIHRMDHRHRMDRMDALNVGHTISSVRDLTELTNQKNEVQIILIFHTIVDKYRKRSTYEGSVATCHCLLRTINNLQR